MTSWIAVTYLAGHGSEFSSSGTKLEMLSLKLKVSLGAFVPLNMVTFVTYNISVRVTAIRVCQWVGVVSWLAGRELPVYAATNDTWQPSLSSFAPPHDREPSGSTKENITKSAFLKILLSPFLLLQIKNVLVPNNSQTAVIKVWIKAI